MKKRLFILVILTLVASFLGIDTRELNKKVEAELSESVLPLQSEIARVRRVIDGDTIELTDDRVVRYIGIDTPEVSHPQKDQECFGRESTRFNKDLVEGRDITLIKDVSDTDKYGRLLRYVYVEEVFVNEHLVNQGYAKVSTYPPDVRYSDLFLAAERKARDSNLGLWSECAN